MEKYIHCAKRLHAAFHKRFVVFLKYKSADKRGFSYSYITVYVRILLPCFKRCNKTDLLAGMGLDNFFLLNLGNSLKKKQNNIKSIACSLFLSQSL